MSEKILRMSYKQTNIDENTFIREFSSYVKNEELVWHRDKNKRSILVLSGEHWKIQIDNELPKELTVGSSIVIKENVYHRLFKGSTDLKIEIHEEL